MKEHIFPAIRLTLVSVFVLIVIYPLFIWGIAQATPTKGEGETVTVNNKTVGYRLEGQSFTADTYFWSRPSAVGYNAAGSAGSNKGPSNPDYLAEVQARIDTFLLHHPGIDKKAIPSELVTASGSGLDPDLSPAAAMIQASRIAAARKTDRATIEKLITAHTQSSFLGLMGPERINVLELNLALDQSFPLQK